MKNKLIEFLEKKIIFIIISIIFAIACLFRLNLYSINKLDILLPNTITVVSIFIGILMSMLGFLLTVSGKSVVRNMKKMGTHKLLLNYFMLPISAGVITVILSIFLIIFDGSKTNLSILISISWIMFISYFTLAFIRIIFLMYYLLVTVFETDIDEDLNDRGRKIEKIENSACEGSDYGKNPYDNPDEFM